VLLQAARGAHTASHAHPLGQTLIVTAGSGRARRWSGAIDAIDLFYQHRVDLEVELERMTGR